MNSLSWFLYFADVSGKTGVLFETLFIFWVVFGGLGIFIWFILYKAGEEPQKPWFKSFVSITILLGFLSIFTPSKETIYLIAGSKASEYVVNTPEAQDIMNDIHSVIKHQLEELQGE